MADVPWREVRSFTGWGYVVEDFVGIVGEGYDVVHGVVGVAGFGFAAVGVCVAGIRGHDGGGLVEVLVE